MTFDYLKVFDYFLQVPLVLLPGWSFCGSLLGPYFLVSPYWVLFLLVHLGAFPFFPSWGFNMVFLPGDFLSGDGLWGKRGSGAPQKRPLFCLSLPPPRVVSKKRVVGGLKNGGCIFEGVVGENIFFRGGSERSRGLYEKQCGESELSGGRSEIVY